MSKNLKSIYKDIINNHNLQESIPEFFEMAAEKYNTYATVRLALNYYTGYEMYWDENWTGQTRDYIKHINDIISDALLEVREKEDLVEYVRQIDNIRSNITERMEMLTLFVDLFEIYEYALNRVEYRFKEMDQIKEDEELAREVLRYIFDSEDNVMINEKIKEVIGQLPVRITKQKYFDYISDSFNELIGASEGVLETYIYIIRSCAMLDISSDMKEAYPELWDKKDQLEILDFKDISNKEYEEASLLVQEAAALLEIESSAYYNLIEIVNELYTILLCAPYIGQASENNNEHRKAALHIIGSINKAFTKDKQEEPTSEILESFGVIEGLQEDMEYDIISLEDIIYQIDKNHRMIVDSLGREEQLHSLLHSKNLQSGSLFVDLDGTDSDEPIDKDRLYKEKNKLINELEERFQSLDRMIVRAVMANTMNKMPVFFNSHTEVMEYVLYSLNKCTDMAEKYASIEIIVSMME
ncbi:MAG: hypothetical protein GX129_00645 [Clostridiales bacterium]|jgi:hypothetical protein|nr:hypothetical protein [Clostridiales bacterium]